MTLNRTSAPITNSLQDLNLPLASQLLLKGNIPLYVINAGVEPIAKIDVVFNAGLINQVKKAQAIFAAAMLTEGTNMRSGKQLADDLDFYGSYFQTRCNADDAVATLYTLTKHLNNCLPLFFEALNASIFPQKELKVMQTNSMQKMRVNEKKNGFIAKRKFYEQAFGENHHYAVNHTIEDIKNITQEDLISIFNSNYKNGIKYVLAAGKIELEHSAQIETEFSNWQFTAGSNKLENKIISQPGKNFYTKTGSVQSAIKIGMTTVNRNHEDYTKLQFLNLLFGGYFGSRLMKNIREDKGLTYGIYSILESYDAVGCWYISTEINNELRNTGVEEIYKEIEKIKTTEFSTSEFEAGKNYYLGSILRGIDGVFSIAERNKILIDYNLDNNYYGNLVNMLNTITTKDLLELSNKYLNTEFIEVIVGK